MKLRVKNNYSLLTAGLLTAATLFTACDDDNAPEMMPEPEAAPSGSLQISDQMLSANKIIVPSISMSQAGWVVVHKATAEGGPVVPDIISIPKQLSAGASSNVEIMLEEELMLMDGETLWVMLHTDDGQMGAYEFDGQNGLDGPIMEGEEIVMQSIAVSAASIMASDQAVTDGMVRIDQVNATVDGWLVIHNDNGNGEIVLPDIIGKVWVEAGTTDNVVVTLDEGTTLQAGQKLFPMLHVDSPANGEYDFPENGDAPEMFGTDIIMTTLTVLE